MIIDLQPILKLDLKDRFEYLRTHEKELLCTKKSTPHFYDYKDGMSISESVQEYGYTEKATIAQKLKNATVLMFDTNVKRAYGDKQFQLYLENDIKQHSIGLQYIDLVMGINDPDDKEHYKNWNKYIEQAINSDKAEREGFFFIVREYRLIENSDVLYGANELTPTIEMQQLDENNLDVKVVANTADWIDTQMDMLIPGSPQKSIKEKGHLIPHLSDHDYTTKAKIGKVKNIYEINIDLNKYIKAVIETPLQKQAVIETPERIDLGKIMFNLNF